MQTVNQLAMETSRVMRGNHSRKTAAFVRVRLDVFLFCGFWGGEPAAPLPLVLTSCSSVRQACAAYSFITIPSLSSIFSRLGLYLLSSQVALANQCLSQGELHSSSSDLLLSPASRLLTLSRVSLPSLPPADAFLKAAVSLLPEVPRSISVEGKLRSSESFLLDFINNFLSTLLVVPVTQSLSCFQYLA